MDEDTKNKHDEALQKLRKILEDPSVVHELRDQSAPQMHLFKSMLHDFMVVLQKYQGPIGDTSVAVAALSQSLGVIIAASGFSREAFNELINSKAMQETILANAKIGGKDVYDAIEKRAKEETKH